MPRNVDVEGLLRALDSRSIHFVVIGGVSASIQGVPAITYDLDLVLDPAPQNLDAALALLVELEAVYRQHLPRKRLEPRRSDLETPGAKLLTTRLGPLDILGELATGWRYSDLDGRTLEVELATDLVVRLLDLPHLIEVKEAVGREKDLAVLPLYRRTLRERSESPADDAG